MKIDENWQKLMKIGNIGKIGENPQIQAKMLQCGNFCKNLKINIQIFCPFQKYACFSSKYMVNFGHFLIVADFTSIL